MNKNSEKFWSFTDNELRQLQIIDNLKINSKLVVMKVEELEECESVQGSGAAGLSCESVQGYAAAGLSSNQNFKKFTEKDLIENIELFKKSVKKFCDNESDDETFDSFRELFNHTQLTEYLFEFCVECKFYGSFFAKVVQKILVDLEDKKYFKNDQSKKNYYDHEKTLSILIEIFKQRFHGDLKEFYQNYKIKSESPIKDYDDRRFRRGKEFFENNEYINKLESIFKNCEHEMKTFFKISAEKFIDFKLLKLIESMLDLCTIKLDNGTNLFIFYPLETKIKRYCRNKKIENSSQSLEPDNRCFFSHFYENSVPLAKLRKIDQDNLLSHDLVYNFLHNQWYILGNFFFNLEILLYITFVIFYSLNSFRLSKEYSYPYEFKWVSLSILIVLIFIEIGELVLLKIYYFYLFSKLFEIINFALVITAISISDDNLAQKSNFYSVSLLSTYFCLIFRIEKIVLFGTYVYTLRKILLKSFKVFPIVFVMYCGFYFSLRTRSRYVTELDQEHDKKEISFTDSLFSISLIKLTEVLFGNLERDQFGLGSDGATSETFTNFLLINIMLYLMPVIFFNLFIGIAVEEVSDLLKKGQLHLAKIRIDYMIKIFYFLNFLNLEKCFASFFQPGYMWHIKKTKKRPIYNIRKYFLLMSNKLSNSRWGATYELKFGRKKTNKATNLTVKNP